MARKGLLLDVTDDAEAPISDPATPVSPAHLVPTAFKTRGAAAMVGRSLADIASTAQEMEAKLTAGQTIVELDPATVDPSFILDRMKEDGETFALLRRAIEEQGQDTPILVRPHPTEQGRYQAAFGHRRLRAAKELGRKVRAVVKKMSDEELVLAQGQENSARVDLSYIERARFAQRLEDLNYRRDVIMAALGVDKAAVSKMISVASRLPAEVIEAIGPAPAAGRPRWIELADRIDPGALPDRVRMLLKSDAFRTADSDGRFNQVFDVLTTAPEMESGAAGGRERGQGVRGDAHFWSSPAGEKLVKITYNTRACAMMFDEKSAPGFADFVATQMDRLFADYSAERAKNGSDPQTLASRRSGKGGRGPNRA